MNSRWTCEDHGAVDPFQTAPKPGAEALAWLLKLTRVPVWLPWPLPPGWFVERDDVRRRRAPRRPGVGRGVQRAGPLRRGRASCSSSPRSRGSGSGAWFAGLPGPDPGPEVVTHPPGARLEAAGWPTQLWSLPRDPDHPVDRAAWVGEARGLWLWLVTWPETADLLLLDRLCLIDLREDGHTLDLPYGAPSPRLTLTRLTDGMRHPYAGGRAHRPAHPLHRQ